MRLHLFFTNAVSSKPDDSKLSKLIKSLLKLPICIIAAAILIPCIILNLVISLVPLLIVLAINKNIANDKKNSVLIEVKSDGEYNKLIEEKVTKLNDDEHNPLAEEQEDNQALINGHSQTVRVISQNTGSEENVDQSTVIDGINNRDVKDGKAIVRVVGNDSNVTMKGIITADMHGHSESTASGFFFGCQIVPYGLDFQFGCKTRTGGTKVEAIEELMQDGSARTMLSGDGGILEVEECNSNRASIEEV
ncbi:MAG: hypothetical protein sL5_01980 [Candidatus Mesenet longicola]|uniref:Uncharacterized protein n=1 Tax=Candidatus Mesenet longicola TaxID=1892558 RepID=A0A8J3HUB7_9RICK|nr:MAG: hypothetical protein sGL2_01410 [Candidatus Mesenet longicola]GHM59205.1 MAG: hypothetical protein sL5_01980 [Candidatus Mesenet longicola]